MSRPGCSAPSDFAAPVRSNDDRRRATEVEILAIPNVAPTIRQRPTSLQFIGAQADPTTRYLQKPRDRFTSRFGPPLFQHSWRRQPISNPPHRHGVPHPICSRSPQGLPRQSPLAPSLPTWLDLQVNNPHTNIRTSAGIDISLPDGRWQLNAPDPTNLGILSALPLVIQAPVLPLFARAFSAHNAATVLCPPISKRDSLPRPQLVILPHGSKEVSQRS
jgi:hypothetical protein